jgi:hypothetical protein
MRNPSRRLIRLMAVAALGRAQAVSWEEVARKVGRLPRTCKGWRHKYRALWKYLFYRAEEQAHALLVRDAEIVLRRLEKERQARARREAGGTPRPTAGLGRDVGGTAREAGP